MAAGLRWPSNIGYVVAVVTKIKIKIKVKDKDKDKDKDKVRFWQLYKVVTVEPKNNV
jgi:hypothetical protein